MALIFVVANSGDGKTSYVSARYGIDRMHGDYARKTIRCAKNWCNALNANGFDVTPPKQHLVYAHNLNIKIRSPYFGTRESWDLDPERMGFKAEEFNPQYAIPYSTWIIDEMQSVFDSHFWNEYSENKSRFLEQCRKIDLTVVFIAQADNLALLRIRQLCDIHYIRKLTVKTDKYGNTVCKWKIDVYHTIDDFHAKRNAIQEEYTFNENIFKYFDTTQGKERFFDGLQNADFEQKLQPRIQLTPDSIAEYVKQHPIKEKKKKES